MSREFSKVRLPFSEIELRFIFDVLSGQNVDQSQKKYGLSDYEKCLLMMKLNIEIGRRFDEENHL